MRGSGDDAAIVVTEGLLRTLSVRELNGVLAHELSHVASGDLRVLSLAQVAARLTRSLASLALLLGLLLMLFAGVGFAPSTIVVLAIAPIVSVQLLLALMRTREYDADLGAVDLTGDPVGLASALARLERSRSSWLDRWLGRRPSEPTTHPATAERIRRLRDVALAGGC